VTTAATARPASETTAQALGEVTLDAINAGLATGRIGAPVDLAKAAVDTYVIGAEADHVVPWQGAYRTTQLLGGEMTFVLSGGGHIQHLVNPPGNPKARYRTGPRPGTEPDTWLAGATRHEGTWWGHWAEWVHARSGAQRPAPKVLGSRAHRPMEPAPGRYGRQK